MNSDAPNYHGYRNVIDDKRGPLMGNRSRKALGPKRPGQTILVRRRRKATGTPWIRIPGWSAFCSQTAVGRTRTVRNDRTRKRLTDQAHVEQGANGGDMRVADASPSAGLASLESAVREASQDAANQLASFVQEIRQAATEQHATEIAQLANRHGEELQRVRETVEAEVTARVKHAEDERHTVEIARLREELEQRHVDELHRAQDAVLNSFKELTGAIHGVCKSPQGQDEEATC